MVLAALIWEDLGIEAVSAGRNRENKNLSMVKFTAAGTDEYWATVMIVE